MHGMFSTAPVAPQCRLWVGILNISELFLGENTSFLGMIWLAGASNGLKNTATTLPEMNIEPKPLGIQSPSENGNGT